MININRLKERLLHIAEIGKTEYGGVTRLALSKEDNDAREIFVKWMTDLDLKVRHDDFGNIYGRVEGTDPDAPVILSGSHLDTVPNGGKYDGVLGVLSALEVIETLLENNIHHRNPIEVVSFTNEEGVRFSPQMLGSGAVTKQFSKDYIYSRKDSQNYQFEDELRNINFLGDSKNRLNKIGAFIEMHIEQGPVLEESNCTIGIVEGISGFSWMEITVYGETNHSGSTPMHYRKDSLVTAASVIKKIQQWAQSKDNGIVATIGKVYTDPGIINAVPGKTVFTVDIRHPFKEGFESCIEEAKEVIEKCIKDDNLTCSIEEIKTHSPISFSDRITSTIEKVSRKHLIPYKRMTSGAGHDAMYINDVADTAMIFVPSINGKSHCAEEITDWDDIEKGVLVLYETILTLTK